MFNFNLFPIVIQDGKSDRALPGLIALAPPRKCARGRENDFLFAWINLSGQTSITPENLQDWLMKKASVYYNTAGTVTSAMRTLVEAINSDLLDRNLRKARDGAQVYGAMTISVIKKDIGYLLNIGKARAWVIKQSEVIEIGDTDNHPNGLGVNQSLTCRFTQFDISENECFLFAPGDHPVWNEKTLTGAAALADDALGRRLLNQAGLNLRGVLVRFVPGMGKINIQKFKFPETVVVESPEVQNKQVPNLSHADGSSANRDGDMQIEVPTAGGSEMSSTSGMRVGNIDSASVPNSPGQPLGLALHNPAVHTSTGIESRQKKQVNVSQRRDHTKSNDELKKWVGGKIEKAATWQGRVKEGLTGFISKIIPGFAEDSFKLSRTVLLVISIAIPVFVVIIAASVYIRNGKSQQFELYFLQGQQYALQAENQVNDAPTRLASLQQSLYWLEKAADYGHTPESDLLRTKVQTALDNIQGIVRLNLKSLTDQSVIGDVSISQMAATTTDLYVLDDKTGRVFRFYLSGSGYQHDSEFDCGPNAANPMNTIGKLVDILPLPVGNQFKATLFGIDATGNIEFCIPGDSGISTVLNPPDMGWGNIKSVSLFQNYLYLLDIGGNAVYRYQGSGINFEEKPTLYFDNQIPSLVDALDIEVNGDELYILRSNSEMVECTYSHIKDYKLTECNDPAPYSDMRTGQAPQAINFPEAQFNQMRMTSAPDSSIYLMDVNGGTIFHFSLQRNLQRILHPRFPDQPDNVRTPLTAFAVSPGKVAFLAYGNKVFYAPLP